MEHRVLQKLVAAKTIIIPVIIVVGVVAAGATAGVITTGEDDLSLDTTAVEETTTTVEETTTTVEETTTTVEETTTTVEETTTTVEETTTTVEETTTTVEETESDGPAEESQDAGSPKADRGPDPHGPAKFGLCKAFGQREELPAGSVAAGRLAAAAEAAGQTRAEFCEDAVPGGRAKVDKPGRSGEHPKGPEAGAGRVKDENHPGQGKGRAKAKG
jgi:hypothetical protein